MKYDLVFEGGGAKGMVFVGAYDEFARRRHTFGRLLGTSAGAITATLLACGYSADELMKALGEQEDGKPVFAGFMGQPRPFTQEEISGSAIRNFLRNINIKIIPDFIEKRMDDRIARILAQNESFRHLFAFVERGGWYAADRFVDWLQNKLGTGVWIGGQRRFSNMTLIQFFDETKVDLSMVASDTTDGQLLVLNHHTAPDCPIVWAVRMSMSIPLVWDEVIWDKTWGLYMGRDITGHENVDRGLLSNFPIELLISNEAQVIQLMGPKGENTVMGWLIDESLPVSQSSGARGLIVDINVKPDELLVVKRLRRLVNTVTTAHDKLVIDAFDHLVVRLPAAGYGTTEFGMSDERRGALVEAGRNAMADYFNNPPTAIAVPRGRETAEAERAKQSADKIAIRLLKL